MWRPNRAHSKLCRDFWKKVLTCIFGCPKLHLGQKKLKKKFQIFSLFIGGTLMIFQEDFWGIFSRKIIRVPPMKSEKNWNFFSSIFFVQDVAWDIQKCMLEVFFKNLYTSLNALYPSVLKFKPPAPFLWNWFFYVFFGLDGLFKIFWPTTCVS